MAIQVSGTEVISNSRGLNNIATVDATTAASITAAGVGGGSLAEGYWATKSNQGSNDIRSYSQHPTDGRILIINGLQNGKITSDYGVSWQSLYHSGSIGGDIYASANNGTGLWVISSNSSRIWYKQDPVANTQWNDAGDQTSVMGNGNYCEAGHFGNGKFLFAAERRYMTSTNGTSWTSGGQITSSGFTAKSIANNGSNWVIVGSSAGGIFYSTNDASSFSAASLSPANTKPFASVYNDGSTFIAVGQDGTLYKSTNNGANWTQITQFTTLNLTNVLYGDDAWVIGADNCAIFTSTDDGASWVAQGSPLDPSKSILALSYVEDSSAGIKYWTAYDQTKSGTRSGPI